MSSFKVVLCDMSEWIKDSAKAAVGSVASGFESQHFLETVANLSDSTGAAGAVFKLGLKMIPQPTAEQRVASQLHRSFLRSLDKELSRKSSLVTEHAWRQYARGNLKHAADAKLGKKFTWLALFGRKGVRSGRSWPIISELADLGRTWIAEAAALEIHSSLAVQRYADDARGRIFEDLSNTMRQLLGEPGIVQAIEGARSQLDQASLKFLAWELTALRTYRLFGEISQHSLYIPPEIKITDHSTSPDLQGSSRLVKSGDKEMLGIIQREKARLIVIQGEMGVGKSCLMRAVTADLAEQYLIEKKRAPVYVRWRDIYSEPDIVTAIETQLIDDFGLTIAGIGTRDDLVYLVDGFDEMSSHQETYLAETFESLSRLQRRGCTVIVSMRSAVITAGLRLALKNREAICAEVQVFDNDAIDWWARKWTVETGAKDVTGERLRSLCRYSGRQNSHSVAQNPLLLYMLAKYIDPLRNERQPLTRTEIFRAFVDETIRGKIRSTREEFPIPFSDGTEHMYRFLLQEMAFLASWPRFSPRCPTRLIRDLFRDPGLLQELPFQDFRTAFVLHFFEPTDSAANEFEFQPEGFRQYLLAEWCVRAQIEALRDESRFTHALTRRRIDAMNVLSQFPLRDEERYILNEIYEELGGLADLEGSLLMTRLTAFGLDLKDPSNARDTIERLYLRVQDHVEFPPPENWKDEKTGIPEGQQVPSGLDNCRFLLNYWDQCMIALLGLYRGLRQDSRSALIFDRDPDALSRFIRFWKTIRGFSWSIDLDLSKIIAPRCDLRNCALQDLDMHQADFRDSNFQRVLLRRSNLSYAILERSNFEEADASGADFSHARIREANLRSSILTNANFTDARMELVDLEHANLDDSQMKLATLSGAILRKARLRRAILEGATLRGAFLEGADLEDSKARGALFTGAKIYGACLKGATLSRTEMSSARLEGANLSGANLRESTLMEAHLDNADLRNANLSLADLRKAIFRGADLSYADLSGAKLDGVDFKEAKLIGVIGLNRH